MQLSRRKGIICLTILLVIVLSLAWYFGRHIHSPQSPSTAQLQQKESSPLDTKKEDILPYLNLKETKAAYALPFCEKKDCIDIDIQTIQTQDQWLNGWVAKNQSKVIQAQIGQNQDLSLQKAIDAYVKKSDAWKQLLPAHQHYELYIQTRIAAQRNQYVLLQINVDSKQEDVTVENRSYFFVADRKLKKTVSILDVLQPKQQQIMNTWVQDAYGQWLERQKPAVRQKAPEKLYWGQSDWFFDGEGIGIHYRANEITDVAEQLDIYLTRQQTQQALQPSVFQQMF